MSREETAARWILWRRAFLVGAVLSPLGALAGGLLGFVLVTAGATVLAAIVLDVDTWAKRRYRSAGAPSLPTLGFIAWGLMATLFAILNVTSGPVSRGELLFAAYVVCWWAVAILLVRGVLSGVVLALALIAVPWGYVVTMWIAWAGVVLSDAELRHAVMTGRFGGPIPVLAALMGALVFGPLTLIAVGLVRAFQRERRRRRDLTVSVLPRSAR